MLHSVYIHHYRSLQNFNVSLADLKSALILGRNGSGKSSIFDALQVFQQIGRGVTQIKQLIRKTDFSFGETNQPICLELTAHLEGKVFCYRLEIEFPERVRESRIKQESLICDNKEIFQRKGSQTLLHHAAEFSLDWHHIGLPLVSVRDEKEPIAVFRQWLKRMIVLSPVPALFSATSQQESDVLDRQGHYVLDWARQLLAESPSLYGVMDAFLKQRLPDFSVFRFETVGRDEKELILVFENVNEQTIELNFSQLSDGEKVFFLTACIVAAFQTGQAITCIWDEPDNYISLVELSHFITTCRKAVENKKSLAQLIVTSHSVQVINEFSRHNTFILARDAHTQPTRLSLLANQHYLSPTLIEAFENGELA